MSAQAYGGVVVRRCRAAEQGPGESGKEILGAGPYEYFIYEMRAGETVTFNELRSFSVYLLEKPDIARVSLRDLSEYPDQGDLIQAEDHAVVLSVTGAPITLLVAGTRHAHPEKKRGIFLSRHHSLYRVQKPWGHELWLNGQHPCYALKQVYIRAGYKTSLQYHHVKQETNVLFEGFTRLHFKKTAGVANDGVSARDIDTADLAPMSAIDVSPGVLHRLEALTDILLYETSTPQLDDVVRVSDDNQRPDGRIDHEHQG